MSDIPGPAMSLNGPMSDMADRAVARNEHSTDTVVNAEPPHTTVV
jgi:hypothetical protein